MCQNWFIVPMCMVRELSEQVLISNSDSQKLGLIKIREENWLDQTVSDHLGSFSAMINNLSASLPKWEEGERSSHVCSSQTDDDL